MANWAWPHTPQDRLARVLLADGPFAGEAAVFVPEDVAAPAQVVWSGWFPWGFAAYLYEWYGEKTMDRGRVDALVFRCTGRRLEAGEIPPLVEQDVELWAGAPAVWAEAMLAIGVPREALWPGL